MKLGLSVQHGNGASSSGTVLLGAQVDSCCRWNPDPNLDLSIKVIDAPVLIGSPDADGVLVRQANSIEMLTKAYNDLAGPVTEELHFLRAKCALLESMAGVR